MGEGLDHGLEGQRSGWRQEHDHVTVAWDGPSGTQRVLRMHCQQHFGGSWDRQGASAGPLCSQSRWCTLSAVLCRPVAHEGQGAQGALTHTQPDAHPDRVGFSLEVGSHEWFLGCPGWSHCATSMENHGY